jgi:hypothetical protein
LDGLPIKRRGPQKRRSKLTEPDFALLAENHRVSYWKFFNITASAGSVPRERAKRPSWDQPKKKILPEVK